MAISFRTAGAGATAASGNVTPALPTGWAANDIFILVVTAKDNVVATLPAGWTKFGETNNGTGLRTTLAWRRAVGGDVAPLVTHTAGANIVAFIAAFPGCITSGTPIDIPGSGFPAANASSATVTTNDFTPTVRDEMVLFVGGTAGGKATQSGYSGTNPTYIEGQDATGSTTAYPGAALAYGRSPFTTACGARTSTASAAGVNNGYQFGLLPDTADADQFETKVLGLSGLRGYWRLNEKTSTTLYDKAGSGKDAAPGTAGTPGGASLLTADANTFSYGFASASSQFLTAANDATFQITDLLTIGCWVKFTSVAVDTNIFSKVSSYYIGMNATSNFKGGPIVAGGFPEAVSSQAAVAAKNYFVVMTYNSTSKVTNLYVNGALDGTHQGVTGPIDSNTNAMEFSRFGATFLGFLNGQASDCFVVNAELSASVINDLYDKGRPTVRPHLRHQSIMARSPRGGRAAFN